VYGKLTKVSLRPLTGRKHQLRQHCAALGTPIMGDDLYHDAASVALEDGRLDRIAHCGDLDSSDLQATEPFLDEHEVDLQSIIPHGMIPNTLLTLSRSAPIDGSSEVFSTHRAIGGADHLNSPDRSPQVRKGVGILLYSRSIDFEHPFPSSMNHADLTMSSKCCPVRPASVTVTSTTAVAEGVTRLQVSISEPSKYSTLLLRAMKGAREHARRTAIAAVE